jgi:hypothetical protein
MMMAHITTTVVHKKFHNDVAPSFAATILVLSFPSLLATTSSLPAALSFNHDCSQLRLWMIVAPARFTILMTINAAFHHDDVVAFLLTTTMIIATTSSPPLAVLRRSPGTMIVVWSGISVEYLPPRRRQRFLLLRASLMRLVSIGSVG